MGATSRRSGSAPYSQRCLVAPLVSRGLCCKSQAQIFCVRLFIGGIVEENNLGKGGGIFLCNLEATEDGWQEKPWAVHWEGLKRAI